MEDHQVETKVVKRLDGSLHTGECENRGMIKQASARYM